MKYVVPILLTMALAPQLALAEGRWERAGGSRDNRGYNYDRGERYNSSGSKHRYYGGGYYHGGYYKGGYYKGYDHYRPKSSVSFGLSFGTSGHYRDDYFGFRYSRGSVYSDCYRPPVVVRERYYDCPPPVIYHPVPRVYYYDCSPGYSSGASVYYYKR